MECNSSFLNGGGGAARCLFGPPNPKTSREVVDKIVAKSAWSFSKKWNFNITADPNPPQRLESSTVPDNKYDWERVYPQDENEKLEDKSSSNKNYHKFQPPTVPIKKIRTTRTLLCNKKTFIKVKITDYLQVKKTKLTTSSSKMV